MQTVISAGKIRQNPVGARLSAACFPTALEFQVRKRVAGALRVLPDAARKAGDKLRVSPVTELADRFSFCVRQFYFQVELPENGERQREHDDVCPGLGGLFIATQRQSETA